MVNLLGRTVADEAEVGVPGPWWLSSGRSRRVVAGQAVLDLGVGCLLTGPPWASANRNGFSPSRLARSLVCHLAEPPGARRERYLICHLYRAPVGDVLQHAKPSSVPSGEAGPPTGTSPAAR